MSEVVTGIAELGQGALTARAVEPAHGGHADAAPAAADLADGHTHEAVCLNCATPLVGSHCHQCGQAAHVHRTLSAFFHDLAHGVFHVEGKIWRTLPMLVLRPGKLTREYIDGRRASYLSPIALFLFSVFLLFAVIHALEGAEPAGGQFYTSIDQATIDQQHQLASLQRKRAAAKDADDQKDLDGDIAEARSAVASLKGLQASGIAKKVSWTDSTNLHTDLPWLQLGFDRFRANPELAIYKLQMTAYKYSWLLIPISVPMLWLLFPFSRRFRLYDHTVFVTYSLAFMTLLALVASLGGALGIPLIALLALAAPVHMFLQLRGTYALGWGSALMRTTALLIFSAAALCLFVAAILSAELAG